MEEVLMQEAKGFKEISARREGAEQGSEAGRQVPEGEEAHEAEHALSERRALERLSPRTSGHPTPTSRTARNWRSA